MSEDKKQKFKRITDFESSKQYLYNSAAIRGIPPKSLKDLAEKFYNNGNMTKKEKIKHEWIIETQLFQRIAKTGEETYEKLSDVYDSMMGKDE